MFNADGQTDMTKLIIAFRNFSNVSKSKQVLYENIRFLMMTVFCYEGRTLLIKIVVLDK